MIGLERKSFECLAATDQARKYVMSESCHVYQTPTLSKENILLRNKPSLVYVLAKEWLLLLLLKYFDIDYEWKFSAQMAFDLTIQLLLSHLFHPPLII